MCHFFFFFCSESSAFARQKKDYACLPLVCALPLSVIRCLFLPFVAVLCRSLPFVATPCRSLRLQLHFANKWARQCLLRCMWLPLCSAVQSALCRSLCLRLLLQFVVIHCHSLFLRASVCTKREETEKEVGKFCYREKEKFCAQGKIRNMHTVNETCGAY